MGLLGNVAEVKDLRHRLMTPELITTFADLLDSNSDGIEVSLIPVDTFSIDTSWMRILGCLCDSLLSLLYFPPKNMSKFQNNQNLFLCDSLVSLFFFLSNCHGV